MKRPKKLQSDDLWRAIKIISFHASEYERVCDSDQSSVPIWVEKDISAFKSVITAAKTISKNHSENLTKSFKAEILIIIESCVVKYWPLNGSSSKMLELKKMIKEEIFSKELQFMLNEDSIKNLDKIDVSTLFRQEGPSKAAKHIMSVMIQKSSSGISHQFKEYSASTFSGLHDFQRRRVAFVSKILSDVIGVGPRGLKELLPILFRWI